LFVAQLSKISPWAMIDPLILKTGRRYSRNGFIRRRLYISSLLGILRADLRYKACRGMNNFSSAYLIVTTLLSRKVAMLILACEAKATEILQTLDTELTPPTYFEALHQAGMTGIIPSLGMVSFYVCPTSSHLFRRPPPFHSQFHPSPL
jgi:hypothetical protein